MEVFAVAGEFDFDQRLHLLPRLAEELVFELSETTARRADKIDHRTGHIIDVMATCVEVGGATYPKKHNGVDIIPMEGESLLPALRGEPPKERTLFFEHEGSHAVRKGKWKIVSVPFRDDRWELYNIAADRQEQNDLAAKYPERVRDMAAEHAAWAKRCFVVPTSRPRPEQNDDKKKLKM